MIPIYLSRDYLRNSPRGQPVYQGVSRNRLFSVGQEEHLKQLSGPDRTNRVHICETGDREWRQKTDVMVRASSNTMTYMVLNHFSCEIMTVWMSFFRDIFPALLKINMKSEQSFILASCITMLMTAWDRSFFGHNYEDLIMRFSYLTVGSLKPAVEHRGFLRFRRNRSTLNYSMSNSG